jgi:riboflavin synthase
MFTGIVQDVGRIVAGTPRGADVRLVIEVGRMDLGRTVAGDSICVQGVCLTALGITARRFEADVSAETLSLTTLSTLAPQAPVNLEPALRAGDALGGHLVSGHVDGIGQVVGVQEDARSLRVTIEAPRELARYLARKGSVAVDGVSLTINDVEAARFGVNLIPHTRAVTTLGQLAPGARVNLEVDPIARYVERLIGERDLQVGDEVTAGKIPRK